MKHLFQIVVFIITFAVFLYESSSKVIVSDLRYSQDTTSSQISSKQQTAIRGKDGFYLSLGVVFQSTTMLEVGLMYGIITEGAFIHGGEIYHILYGIKVSTEATYINNNTLLGPKFSIESNFFNIFGGRVSIINYTSFKKSDFCLTPEIGMSLGGYFTIFYGYNAHLSKNHINEISNHRLSITLNL